MIEDYKLEITALQQRDTQLAKENGFESKKDWYAYIMQQNIDEIADAILDIAKRYNIPVKNVASNFDPSMVMRVGHILSLKENTVLKK